MRWPIPDPHGWRRWFAWYTVEIEGQYVRWEWVERRYLGAGHMVYHYEYRFPYKGKTRK